MTNPVPSQQSLWTRRNAEGRIVALTRQLPGEQEAQAGGWEIVLMGDAEVDEFVQGVSGQVNPMRQSDVELSRVLEDLIDLLIDRGVIQFTDLPTAAQVKLLQRRLSRDQYARRLDLLPDDGS